METNQRFKYEPDWNQTRGKVIKADGVVRIHPHDLIALVHKKKGLDHAGKLAIKLLSTKYDRIFDESKA